MHPVPVLYSAERKAIPQGSLLLWRRGRNLGSRAIAGGDRTVWSHVGRVRQGLVDGEPRSLEFLQFRGPVRKRLEVYVADFPGRIDVFAPNLARFPEYDPERAVQEMRDLMRGYRGRYGWGNAVRVGLSLIPGVRSWLSWSTDDAANGGYPPHCSDATSRCDRLAGVDPVPNTPSWATTPGDFGRSLLYQYRYTLHWTAEQVRLAEAA